MSSKTPWRHHYIPQFLLKQWAGPDGKVERYTRPHKSVLHERVATKAAGFERDLYSIKDKSIQLEDGFFKLLDQKAAIAHQKLLRGIELTTEDKVNWIVFIRSMMHRTPSDIMAFKSAAVDYMARLLPELERTYQSVRGSTDPETFEDYVATRKPHDDEKFAIQALPSILLNQNIIESLLEMPWIVISFPKTKSTLLISDAPVIRSNGIKISGGHLAMPIGPRSLFFVHFDDYGKKHVLSMTERQLVAACNSEVVGRARTLVVSTDQSQTRFIENRMGGLDRFFLIDGSRANPDSSKVSNR